MEGLWAVLRKETTGLTRETVDYASFIPATVDEETMKYAEEWVKEFEQLHKAKIDDSLLASKLLHYARAKAKVCNTLKSRSSTITTTPQSVHDYSRFHVMRD